MKPRNFSQLFVQEPGARKRSSVISFSLRGTSRGLFTFTLSYIPMRLLLQDRSLKIVGDLDVQPVIPVILAALVTSLSMSLRIYFKKATQYGREFEPVERPPTEDG